MASGVKLSFSDKELDFIQQTDLLLTKRIVTQKLYRAFGELQKSLTIITEKHQNKLPEALRIQEAKISRGENYKGLPYIVLDYPRLFQQSDIFTYRTLFWWGHYYSCTLHLQGSYLQQYQHTLVQNLDNLKESGFYVSIGQKPWEHHFEPNNYQLLSDLHFSQTSFQEFLANRTFLRLSKQLELNKFDHLAEFTAQTWRELLTVLSTKA